MEKLERNFEGKYYSTRTSQNGACAPYEVELEEFADEMMEVGGIAYHLNTSRHQAAAVVVKSLHSRAFPINYIQEKVIKDGESYEVVFLFVIANELYVHVPKSIKEVYVEKFPIENRYLGFIECWKLGVRFLVDNRNPYLLATPDGSLYSKDGKTLLHYNPYKGDGTNNSEELLPTVRSFAPGSLAGSRITVIPKNVEVLDCDLAYANKCENNLMIEGEHTTLVLPENYRNMTIKMAADLEEADIKTYEGEEMSIEQKNMDEHFFFRAPKPDETPAIGHIVSFTQAPDRVWEGMKKNISTWRQTIKVNALAVGAIEPLMMKITDKGISHTGTRIYLLGSSLAGLNLAEQKALLDKMGKQDYVCTFEVYENPEMVYQRLIEAGWQGE